MNTMMRPLIIGGFLGLLAVGIFSLRFACTAPDFQEEIRDAKLVEMRRETLIRLEARDQVVRDLIAQRCTLAEAIENFLKLDPPWPYLVPKVPPGHSPQEKSYQYIRFIVEAQLQDHPEQASIVLRRLEQEFEKLRSERQTPSTTANAPTEPRTSNKK
jgi:hypothetical protein